ncbi:MAG: hypothetical protein RLP09_19600 [Sandaracinaceae bacterium]
MRRMHAARIDAVTAPGRSREAMVTRDGARDAVPEKSGSLM